MSASALLCAFLLLFLAVAEESDRHLKRHYEPREPSRPGASNRWNQRLRIDNHMGLVFDPYPAVSANAGDGCFEICS
jgi:hypothetical protein